MVIHFFFITEVLILFATSSFTQRNLLRIYPKGTRFNSSNYNPFLGWVHGAQMVAFNMQVMMLARDYSWTEFLQLTDV
jgi:hypothetical protein